MKQRIKDGLYALKTSAFAGNVLTLLSGSVVSQLIPLAVYPLVTRLYTPAELGLFAAFMTYAGALAVVATMRYDQAILLPARDEEAGYLFRIAVFVSAIIAGFSWVFVQVAGSWFGAVTGLQQLQHVFWLLPLAVLFTGLFNSMNMLANRYQRYRQIARAAITQSGTSSAVKLLGGVLSPGAAALIASYIAGHAIAAVWLLRSMLRHHHLQRIADFNRLRIRHLMFHYRHFPAYDMPQILVYTISGNLPVLVFTRFFSESQAGFYALAFAVVFRPLNLVAKSVRKVLAQRTIQQFNAGNAIYPSLRKLALRMLLVSIPPALLAGLVAPPVFTWLFGNDWQTVGIYLQVLLPLLVFIFLETVFDFVPNMFFRQRTVFVISLFYFGLRLLSLAVGVWLNDVLTALLLFSLSGMLVKAGSFIWYLYLARSYDAQRLDKR